MMLLRRTAVARRSVSTFSIQLSLQRHLLGAHEDFSMQNTLFRRSHQPNVDYQTSAVMSLGLPKASVLPTAEEIAYGFNQYPMVESATATKPGFINVKLDDEWIAKHAVHVAADGVCPRKAAHPEHVLVDFASPNMGKELHVGHLRSSVLGDTICNVLEFQGACHSNGGMPTSEAGQRVTRVSHVGDLGAAIATLLVQAVDTSDNAANDLPVEFTTDSTTVVTLGQWYERGKHRLGNGDAAFKADVDRTVLALQRDDGSWKAPWELTCAVSRDAHNRLYKRLGVQVHERGESSYLTLIPTVLEKLKSVTVESQGALCIFVDGPEKTPMLVRKQDGGFLYATTDLAALYSRVFGWENDPTAYDRLVYVTDTSQSLHFRHLFDTAKLAGWLDKRPVQLQHVGFGLVMGEDGTKLSSRKGGATTLEALLDEAALESKQRSIVAEADHGAIGDAAVRYYDLAQHRERNYKFSYASVLNLKGNTAPYLLYASARLQGILRKANVAAPSWNAYLLSVNDPTTLLSSVANGWHPNERALALVLGQFEDALLETQHNWYAHQSHPHFLADYLFRLTSQFHAFYETCHVQNNSSRLVLCASTDAVLRRGLQLLGIAAQDRM
ncbi:Aste57867_10842 [Aphanomyces stellatus]|uniref:arginine--tRNA ligase n=1 Tax=Aphanomyces stellatus TaxID=120398 RepID=A0A485KS00_9STRA|nr:hypothetical protein As57867_010802 [Aphanomyces stellatus]VFT87710.1 Aste57867_10842 [Aphanomyces stellatus]